MPNFRVSREEIYDVIVEIEADSKEDAIAKIEEGEGEEIDFSFKDFIKPSDEWEVVELD